MAGLITESASRLLYGVDFSIKKAGPAHSKA